MAKIYKRLKHPTSKSTKKYHVKNDEVQNDNGSKKPIFSFHFMNYGGGNCLSKCESSDQALVSKKLLKMSQLTWDQIMNAPKEGNGGELIDASQFKVGLPPIITPDVSLFVVRISERGRMAGLRIRDIYHIIVVSPLHDLY